MFNFPLNFSSYRCMLAYEAAQMRISAILNGEFVCSVQVVASKLVPRFHASIHVR